MIRRKRQAGLTLIELMMAAGLSVFVVSITYVMWQLFLGSFNSSFEGARNVPAANQTVNSLTREIREMATSETGAYPLEIVNDQELAFYQLPVRHAVYLQAVDIECYFSVLVLIIFRLLRAQRVRRHPVTRR